MNIISEVNVRPDLDWPDVIGALIAGHKQDRARLQDSILEQTGSTLLSRSAWVKGLGYGVKSVTITRNRRLNKQPSVQGSMLIFDDQTGQPKTMIDSQLLTYWKTAADSVLGAKLLARPESRSLLIIGAGVVALSLVRAYASTFFQIDDIKIFNRNRQKAKHLAQQLVAEGYPCTVSTSVSDDALNADIIACATMANEPVLLGENVSPGTHVDLVGAYKLNMREADNALLQKSRLFVDCFDTTLEQIGELVIPITSGAIKRTDVLGDLYDLVNQKTNARLAAEEITVFKNGGGAHLDLMTAHAIISPTSTMI